MSNSRQQVLPPVDISFSELQASSSQYRSVQIESALLSTSATDLLLIGHANGADANAILADSEDSGSEEEDDTADAIASLLSCVDRDSESDTDSEESAYETDDADNDDDLSRESDYDDDGSHADDASPGPSRGSSDESARLGLDSRTTSSCDHCKARAQWDRHNYFCTVGDSGSQRRLFLCNRCSMYCPTNSALFICNLALLHVLLLSLCSFASYIVMFRNHHSGLLPTPQQIDDRKGPSAPPSPSHLSSSVIGHARATASTAASSASTSTSSTSTIGESAAAKPKFRISTLKEARVCFIYYSLKFFEVSMVVSSHACCSLISVWAGRCDVFPRWSSSVLLHQYLHPPILLIQP